MHLKKKCSGQSKGGGPTASKSDNNIRAILGNARKDLRFEPTPADEATKLRAPINKE
jgi:hypothetical protein